MCIKTCFVWNFLALHEFCLRLSKINPGMIDNAIGDPHEILSSEGLMGLTAVVIGTDLLCYHKVAI